MAKRLRHSKVPASRSLLTLDLSAASACANASVMKAIMMMPEPACKYACRCSLCSRRGSTAYDGGRHETVQVPAFRVIASTSWTASFARAAGATDIIVVGTAMMPATGWAERRSST